MRVIFTCGGTAGHVNPALALAGLMTRRLPDVKILFVGANRGMERRLVEQAGYEFRAVEISGFHRSLSPREMAYNLMSLHNYFRAPREARRILDAFQPDLVVGTGGYASYPMVRAAAAEGVPTAVHESNAIPGLTTKLLEPFVDVVMVGFEDCRRNYRHPQKVRVTGTPIRGEFFTHTRREAKAQLGLDDGLPLVLSFWGSLGAREMNIRMADYITQELKLRRFRHIHAAGTYGIPRINGILSQREIDLKEQSLVEVREYIYDMPLVMRAADLVLCRAGASTISELTALGAAAIIVPSPNVANNHQEKNAQVLSDHGAALLIHEAESSGPLLLEKTLALLDDDDGRLLMEQNMAALGVRDAGERIYRTVMELAGR